MTDDELRASVVAELDFDPKVGSRQIAVVADGGTVTLRGTVGSLREKREALSAARRVYGVSGVSNQLEVRILAGRRRSDADQRADVLHALTLDSLIPATIDARVQGGLVTLVGTAGWQYQRDEAELICASVPGVLAIEVQISLTPARAGRDIEQAISAALARRARLDGDELSVDIPVDGMVVLSGVVSCWAERDDAVAAAWSAPGVTRVDDRIAVDG